MAISKTAARLRAELDAFGVVIRIEKADRVVAPGVRAFVERIE